ncbi:MAG: SurA N-terminal domain-containing protein, partial [Candidatus Omnitrophica bacterium]|nr:SurA N-terminal domain-containing protein [Candidatus Omnitrophota bacterium]
MFETKEDGEMYLSRFFRLVFAFLICAGIASAGRTSFGEMVDKVIVVVNNEVITQKEFDRIYGPIKSGYEASFKGKELETKLQEAKKGLLEQLIDAKIIIGEAKKSDIKIDEKDVKERIDKIKAYYVSEEEFLQALSSKGSTLTEVEKDVKEQLLGQKYVERELVSKIMITPAETKELYEKNKEKLISPEKVKVRGIMIRKKEGEDVKVEKAKIKELQDELKSGKDFAELARTKSEGPYVDQSGDMG